MVHLTADAIAELYIGQNDSMTLLRNNCSTAMLKADELKDKIDEKKDTLKRLQNASKETNQHKSFYQELDVVEKELHDRVHLNEMAMEKAKKAKLNVSYITNVLKKLRYVSQQHPNIRINYFIYFWSPQKQHSEKMYSYFLRPRSLSLFSTVVN